MFNLTLNSNNIILAEKSDWVKNTYNLGYYDIYPYNNDDRKVLRRTGYLVIDADRIRGIDVGGGSGVSNVAWTNILTPSAKRNWAKPTGICSAKNSSGTKIVVYGLSIYWMATNCIGLTEEDYVSVHIDGCTSVADYQAKCPIYVEYELNDEHIYIEDVINDFPINVIPQKGTTWIKEEWQKGLNLWDAGTTWSASSIHDLTLVPGRKYTISHIGSATISVANDSYSSWAVWQNTNKVITFVAPSNIVHIKFDTASEVTDMMINEGSYAYPYVPYYGKLTRVSNFSNGVLTLVS